MNEITVSLETLATLAALEGRPLAQDANNLDTLLTDIASRYAFLARPISVEVRNAKAFIRWADRPSED
jgi:hypothetical protein